MCRRYQSVTNWFQNQRSIAKKRKEDQDALNVLTRDNVLDRPSSSRAHTYSPFPPSSSVAHPSLSVPPAAGHPSLSLGSLPRARRSPSLAPAVVDRSIDRSIDSRASSPRPGPYGMAERVSSASSSGRARRSRPEPYQLEALKKLFHRNATPSIEERGALALEINMDVGKVTNWFRNLRQSSRKRSKLGSGSDDDDDDVMSVSVYGHDYSRNVSRAASPASMSSDERDPNAMDTDYTDVRVKAESEQKRHALYTHPADSRSSDMASEEDAQEAVTPSPASSPYPAFPIVAQLPQKSTPAPQIRRDSSSTYAVNGLSPSSDMEKAPAQLPTGVRVEDALLLLSFSHNTAR